MIFKNNVEFIIPRVLSFLPFPTRCIKHANVEMIFKDFNFIVIQVENFKTKESTLEKDKTFYNVEYTNNGMILRYLIPNTALYVCKILMQCGYEGLTKDQLLDCITFWKKNCVSVLEDNKALATRISGQGLLF